MLPLRGDTEASPPVNQAQECRCAAHDLLQPIRVTVAQCSTCGALRGPQHKQASLTVKQLVY